MRATLCSFLLAAVAVAQDADRPSGPDPRSTAEAYDRAIQGLFAGRGLGRGGDPAAALAALDRLGATPAPGLETRGEDLQLVVRAYLAGRVEAPGTTGRELADRVDRLRAAHGWDGHEQLDKRKTDPRTLLAVAIDARLAQTLPAEELAAHPAAAVFPGSITAAAPRVARRIGFEPSVPRWRSTGLWAPAREAVRVEVPDLPAGATLTVIVGSHTDSVVGRPRWARFPQISRRFRIDRAGSHRVGNAFGGLLYLACDRGEAEPFAVTIEGAVEAPFFELGVSALEDWRTELRDRPAPFGELACGQIVWTLPSAVLRTCEDPDEVLRFWARVVEVQDQLAHHQRTSPERFVLDRQISVGYMHSGYPLMGPVSAAAAAVDVASLREKGNWGMFHEIGHNHQTVHYGRYANPWTFDDNVEVTVNLFSAWTYVAALGRSDTMGHQHWRTELLAENLAKEFSAAAYPEKPHRERCLFWVHLIEEFGWDAVREVFRTYAALPDEARPQDDLDKRSLFLEIWSEQVGRDLGPFFAAWGLEVRSAARAKAAALPAFEPRVPLPAR
jgi:hypothetical protein